MGVGIGRGKIRGSGRIQPVLKKMIARRGACLAKPSHFCAQSSALGPMNTEELNRALVALIEKKAELHTLTYDDARYDDVEEALHDLEDDFNDEYGDFLESALDKVHTDLKSDTDVLLPTAYLPSTPGSTPSPKEGVWVDSEKYPGKEARITLIPNPVRIMLTVGKQVQQELWKA